MSQEEEQEEEEEEQQQQQLFHLKTAMLAVKREQYRVRHNNRDKML